MAPICHYKGDLIGLAATTGGTRPNRLTIIGPAEAEVKYVAHAMVILLLNAAAVSGSLGPSPQAASTDPVLAWLRDVSRPLAGVAPGTDASDLRPLKESLEGVRVVGLGESTHGAREIFLLKDRLLRFLVSEMGFTTLAMEASVADCEPINDFILHGKGDLAAVLTRQGYTAWDTEEIAAMIAWMRDYNRTASARRKVQFVGLDIVINNRGRELVLDYVKRRAPERAAQVEALFRILAEEQDNFPLRVNRARLAETRGDLQALRAFLSAERDRHTSEAMDIGRLIEYVEVMDQRAMVGTPENLGRSRYMSRNLLKLLERAPDTKVVVWAHNGHVGAGTRTGDPNLGSELRAAMGRAYYALGIEFGRGASQFRRGNADGSNGALEEIVAGPPPEGSLPERLSRIGRPQVFVNFRASRTPAVETWLTTTQPEHGIGWVYAAGTAVGIMEDGKPGRFDGYLFVESVTSARPTANARDRAAKRTGV